MWWFVLAGYVLMAVAWAGLVVRAVRTRGPR